MLWVACGLAAAFCSALGGIVCERTKTSGDILAVWFRIIAVVATLPFVAALELPAAWQYWALVLFNAGIMGFSDIISFRTIKTIGAGAQSRFRRTAILVTFLLWLVASPAVLWGYLETPLVALAILATHVLAVYFAIRLKKDKASWDGLRMMWFPILATSIAPIVTTLSFSYAANSSQGVFSYILIQSTTVMMIFTVRSLVLNGWQGTDSLRTLVADGAWKPGIAMGLAVTAALALKNYAYTTADNPAYVSVLQLTDTLWLLLYHKWRGVQDKTDIVSGMGIVGCATALILIKIFLE